MLIVIVAGALVTGCGRDQNTAQDGLVRVDPSTTATTSRIVPAEVGQNSDLPVSSDEASAVAGENLDGENQRVTTLAEVVVTTNQVATSSTSTTSKLVDGNDLVACANVETGYLFLLDGRVVQANPYLETGSSQASQSGNPAYVKAALSLSQAASQADVQARADEFMSLCESDGYERLA